MVLNLVMGKVEITIWPLIALSATDFYTKQPFTHKSYIIATVLKVKEDGKPELFLI